MDSPNKKKKKPEQYKLATIRDCFQQTPGFQDYYEQLKKEQSNHGRKYHDNNKKRTSK